MTGTPSTPLTCGTDPQQLLDQVGDGRGSDLDDHQAGCPHCQQALRIYRRLWAPFEILAAQTVRAPRGMASRAVAWIRAVYDDTTATPLPITGLPPGLPGTATVTTRVVIRCARLAAEQVDGVRLALSELSTSPPAAHSGSDPGRGQAPEEDIVLVMTVAAEHGHDLHALGRRIRTAVDDALRSLTGRTPRSIDVHIDDVLTTAGPG